MTEFTAHFRLPVPDFNQEPWHDQFRDLCVAIDDMAFEALLANSSAWANDTVYAVGAIVLDDTNGLLYVCAIAHTSPPTPTTFLTFRNANPAHWNSIAQIPQQRGTWQTATTYVAGDFVIDNSRYAVCLVSHVSTVFNTDLGAGKWSILIDLTAINVGVNGLAETTIAAAATVDLGAASPTMLLVSGSGQTINSFGTFTNLMKILRFNGVNTITHNSVSLILLNGENRTTADGDVMFVRSDVSGNWRQLNYFSRATEAARGSLALATTAEANAGTNDADAMTPLKSKAQWNTMFDIYFPVGTKVLFQQTTPPTGWTKDVVHNDKALRVVTGAVGSGGSSAFTTVFGKTATDNYTLVTADMPSHEHGSPFNTGAGTAHTHLTVDDSGSTTMSSTTRILQNNDPSNVNAYALTGSSAVGDRGQTTAESAHTHQVDITPEGGGGAHSHPIDIRVQYIDVVVATRNA